MIINLKKINFLKLDFLILLLFIIFFIFIRQDYAVSLIFIFLLFYLIYTKRINLLAYLLISFFISFIWMFFAYEYYLYNQEFISIFKISIFPLFAWTCGMFLLYNLYHRTIKIKNEILKFFLFVLIYSIFLIIVETIGYHLLDIKNDLTTIYPGISFCNCIHAPRWMQISYFLLGPIYYLSSKTYIILTNKTLKSKNKHK